MLSWKSSNYKEYLSVCYLDISRTVHPIYFTLVRFVTEDQRKCSVKVYAIWTRDTLNINTS